MSREDEIRGRLDAATRGPWHAAGDYVLSVPLAAEERIVDPAVCRVVEQGSLHDAKLIANAPADLAYLLDRVSSEGPIVAAAVEVLMLLACEQPRYMRHPLVYDLVQALRKSGRLPGEGAA